MNEILNPALLASGFVLRTHLLPAHLLSVPLTAPCQATGQQSRIFGAGTGLAAHSLGAVSWATLGAVPRNLHCVLTASCARERHVELKASTLTAFS